MGGTDDVAPARLASVAIFPNQGRRIVAMLAHQARNWIDGGTVVSGDDDRLAPVGEDVAPGILRFVSAAVEAFEAEEPRAQPPEACLFEADHAPGRFHVGP